MYYQERVNFTTSFGDQVSFDENGDALPIYDVMNWLWLPNGKTKVQRVGDVKRLDSNDEKLTLDETRIFWNFESKQVMKSLLSIFTAYHIQITTLFHLLIYSPPGQCAVKAAPQVHTW